MQLLGLLQQLMALAHTQGICGGGAPGAVRLPGP